MRDDRLRDAYEKRKAERAPAIKKWNWPLTISVFALTASATSIMFNIFIVIRQTDDLKMIVRDLPWLQMGKANEFYFISADQPTTLIFVNSGNRTNTVLVANLSIKQYIRPPKSRCSTAEIIDVILLETDFKPTIIKGNDVIRSDIKIVDMPDPVDQIILHPIKNGKENVFKIPLHDKLRGSNEGRIDICLDVQVATPSIVGQTNSFLLDEFKVNKNGEINRSGELTEADYLTPKILIPRARTLMLP